MDETFVKVEEKGYAKNYQKKEYGARRLYFLGIFILSFVPTFLYWGRSFITETTGNLIGIMTYILIMLILYLSFIRIREYFMVFQKEKFEE
jgi:hypothetical protein